MAEYLAVSDKPQVRIELGTSPLGPCRFGSFRYPKVVLGEIDIVINRDRVRHEGVVGFVAADQEGPDQPWRGMQHEKQDQHHGRFVSVREIHRCILSQEGQPINMVKHDMLLAEVARRLANRSAWKGMRNRKKAQRR